MEDRNSIRIEGKIEEPDYIRAQWLHLRPRPLFAVLGVVFVLLLLAGAAVQIAGWVQGRKPASDALMLPFLALVFLGYFALLSWKFKHSYRNYKAIQSPFCLELSEDEFHATSNHGEVRLPWDMFRKYKENAGILLLYQSDGLFHVLPKRLFRDAGEVQRAREVISKKVRSAT